MSGKRSGARELPAMILYFADESGDPGRAPGSSPAFAVCLLRVDGVEARGIEAALDGVRRRHGLHPAHEFRWSRNRPDIRLAALAVLSGEAMAFRCRVWRKRQALPAGLLPVELEGALARACLEDFGPGLTRARLIIDGQRSRERSSRMRRALAGCRSSDGSPCIVEVRLRDSSADSLLQAADLLAGWSLSDNGRQDGLRRVSDALVPKGSVRDWP